MQKVLGALVACHANVNGSHKAVVAHSNMYASLLMGMVHKNTIINYIYEYYIISWQAYISQL